MDKETVLLDVLPKSFTNYESFAEKLSEFLIKYSNLHSEERTVINFLVEGQYESRVPYLWRQDLDQLSLTEILDLIQHGEKTPHFSKLSKSFQEFLNFSFSLRMGHIDNHKPIPKTKAELYAQMQNPNFDKSETLSKILPENLQKKVEILLKDGVFKKKEYELDCILKFFFFNSKIFKRCSSEDPKTSIFIDLGSGKGYTSHLLGFLSEEPQFPLKFDKVLGIECSEVNNNSFQTRTDRIKEKIKKTDKTSHENEGKFQTSTQFLTESNFSSVIDQEIQKQTTKSNQNFEIMTKKNEIFLFGLHTCGNLGVLATKIFCSHPSVKYLLNLPW